jgi:hypothetical protein
VIPLIAAEWTKLRSLRSTFWTLLAVVVLCVGMGGLFAFGVGESFERMPEPARRNFDPVSAGFYGLTLGLIPLVVFGVLIVSAEYGNGTILASLMAVPRRGRFYAAKVLTGMLVVAGVAGVIAPVTFAVSQSALTTHAMSIGDPGVARAIFGAWAYLTLMFTISMGLAMMIRSTAVSLGVLIPLLFLNSQGLGNLPKFRTVAQFLPDQAGFVMMQVVQPEESFISHRDFGPTTGLLILLAWTALTLLGGYLVLRHRDAT